MESSAMTIFINTYLKLFLILTPFFVVSVFVSMTRSFDSRQKKATAIKVTLAVLIASFVLYQFGEYIFTLFGITIDAFRIGAGSILFLSAINMVQGPSSNVKQQDDDNIAVVPLAIPITVGPGAIGALLVMGTETGGGLEGVIAMVALLCAILSVGVILLLAGKVERIIGQQGLIILTKLTGLFVAAIAAQIVFTGVKNFLAI
jgi:multiple antibiotic resistance protein